MSLCSHWWDLDWRKRSIWFVCIKYINKLHILETQIFDTGNSFEHCQQCFHARKLLLKFPLKQIIFDKLLQSIEGVAYAYVPTLYHVCSVLCYPVHSTYSHMNLLQFHYVCCMHVLSILHIYVIPSILIWVYVLFEFSRLGNVCASGAYGILI